MAVKVFNSNDVALTTIAMKNNFVNELWILDIGTKLSLLPIRGRVNGH
jgi:hypothetical protein